MLSGRVPSDSIPNAWSRLLSERRAAGAALIDLTEANPTRVGLSGVGVAELAALATAEAMRYEPDPRGARAARQAVAGYYRERGLAADANEIVLTASTSEAYAHLFRLLAEPGQTFLVPAPSYPLFEPLAALEGVRLRRYRLAWDGCWHLDLGSLEAAMDAGARGMIVVQPNHPTGSCLAPDELAAAEALCERCGAALISDEVFGDFAWPSAPGSAAAAADRGGAPPRGDVEAPAGGETGSPAVGRGYEGGPSASLPSLLGSRRVPTFVLSGLSKVCGMPQLKLGWMAVAGPEPARAEALRGLEWIADLFLSVATPVQVALPRLLAGRHAWQARVRERIAANLARLRAGLARQPALDLLAGSGGWVAVVRVPRRRSEEEWALELLRRGVVVHPGHFYDFEGEAYLVVSLIVAPADFSRGVDTIEALAGEG
jgi:aspartate/methionine/tyrosine aminotransferase